MVRRFVAPRSEHESSPWTDRLLGRLTDDELGALRASILIVHSLLGGRTPARLRALNDDLLARCEARLADLPEPPPPEPIVTPDGTLNAEALARALVAAPPWDRPGVIALAALLGVELPPNALAEAEAADAAERAREFARDS